MDKQKILIVEDDRDTAILFHTVLSLVGMDSDIVRTGKEAIAWLASSVPDMILLDMRLGLEISGSEILYQVRSNPRFDNTRVIIITGYPRMAEPITDLADLILLKPVDVDQLKELAKRMGDFHKVEPKRQVFQDPVTELSNEALFINRLELAYERTKRRPNFLFALMIFEPHFDSPAHDYEGETHIALLKQIAARLKKNLRPTDSIARLSGWKFATLHEELVKPEDIEIVIHRLHGELSKAFPVGDQDHYLSIKYGAAVYDRRYSGVDEMIEAAEGALDQAVAFLQEGFYVVARMPRMLSQEDHKRLQRAEEKKTRYLGSRQQDTQG